VARNNTNSSSIINNNIVLNNNMAVMADHQCTVVMAVAMAAAV
jgi:hypothetical protein